MKLLGNRILVERIVAEKSTGGILFPSTMADDLNTGGAKVFRVVDVGPGRVNHKGVLIPTEVKPGDRVIAHSYTDGVQVMEDGKRIISEDMILLIL